MRIGVIRHFYEPHLPPEDETRRAFEAALQELTKLGAVLEEVRLRELEDYDDCKVIISEAEFLLSTKRICSKDFKITVPTCAFAPSPAGSSERSIISRRSVSVAKLVAEMQTLFAGYDAMVTLCTYGPAPKMSTDEPTHFFSGQT